MNFVVTYKFIYVMLLLADYAILASYGFENHLLFQGQDKDTLYIVYFAAFRAGYLIWNIYNMIQLYRRKIRVEVYLSENLFAVCRIFMNLLVLIPMTMAFALLVSPIVISFWAPIFSFIKILGINEILGLTYGYTGLLVVCLGLIALEVFYIRRLDVLAGRKEKKISG